MKAYTSEQDNWLIEHQEQYDYEELATRFTKKFNTNKTKHALQSHCYRVLHLNKTQVCKPRRFTPEIVQWLTQHLHLSYEERTEQLNAKFGADFTRKSIETYCSRHGLLSKNSTRYKWKPGRTTWNEGMTGVEYWSHYKNPDQHLAHILSMSDSTRKYKPGDIITTPSAKGALSVYLTHGKSQRLSVYNYIQKYGEIPDGYQLIHIDGDVTNADPDSLWLIPITWISILNSVGGLTDNVELNKTKLKYCRLYTLLKLRKRGL